MRVITGSVRGKRLKAPAGMETRPTTDKVKEAICSALQFEFPGAVILDLFAGSGQMAIEALSRGALRAVLVDNAPRALACIRENLQSCGFSERALVLRSDAETYLRHCREQFQIAFLDPPYRQGILEKILPLLIPHMAEDGWIVCEHEPECSLPQTILNFDLQKERKYGKINVTLYRRAEEASLRNAERNRHV